MQQSVKTVSENVISSKSSTGESGGVLSMTSETRLLLKTINRNLLDDYVVANKSDPMFASCFTSIKHPAINGVDICVNNNITIYLRIEFNMFMHKNKLTKNELNSNNVVDLVSNADEYPFYTKLFNFSANSIKNFNMDVFIACVQIQHFF